MSDYYSIIICATLLIAGLSGFVQDSREYYKVTTDLWSGRSLTELSRRQLEILRQVLKLSVRIKSLFKNKEKFY